MGGNGQTNDIVATRFDKINCSVVDRHNDHVEKFFQVNVDSVGEISCTVAD